MSKQIFDAAQMRVLSLMESDSLSTFQSSETLKELTKRIQRGEMDKLVQEDIESVKDIMSKEVSESMPGARPARRKLDRTSTAAAASGTAAAAAAVVAAAALEEKRKCVLCTSSWRRR